MALSATTMAALGGAVHTAGIYSDSTGDGPEIGTLVLIIDRAKNLPNRKTLGKQDPYCAARLGKEAHKTETDRRGGQTPRWDQELRFTVHDSPDYYQLKVSVFNDDKKSDIIGETWVDLKNLITPGGGQNDLWHSLNCRGKYAGEIRIEMTYYDTRPKEERADKRRESSRFAVEEPRRGSLGGPRQFKDSVRRPLPANPTTPPAAVPGVGVIDFGQHQASTASQNHTNDPFGYQINPGSRAAEYNTSGSYPNPHPAYRNPQHPSPREVRSAQHSREGTYHNSTSNYIEPTVPSRLEIYDPGNDGYIPGNILGRPEEFADDGMDNEIQDTLPEHRTDQRSAYSSNTRSYNSGPPPLPSHRARRSDISEHPMTTSTQNVIPHSRSVPMMAPSYQASHGNYAPPSVYDPTIADDDVYQDYPAQDHHDLRTPPRHHSYDAAYASPAAPPRLDEPGSPPPPPPPPHRSSAGQMIHALPRSHSEGENPYVPHAEGLEYGMSSQNHSLVNRRPVSSHRSMQHIPAAQSGRRSGGRPDQPPSYEITPVRQQGDQSRELLLMDACDASRGEISAYSHERERNRYRTSIDPPPFNGRASGSESRDFPGGSHESDDALRRQSGSVTNQHAQAHETLRQSHRSSAPPTAPMIKPRAVSPDPRKPARKSVSPQPVVPPEERRLSGVPFSPDSYESLNPGLSHSRSMNDPSGLYRASTNEQEIPGKVKEGPNEDEPIIGADGRVIDPSDHLPTTTWAPEPERKTPQKAPEPTTRSRPSPQGAQPMPPSGRRLPREPASGRPQPINTDTAISTPTHASRNRLQKKSPASPTVSTMSSSPVSLYNTIDSPRSLPRAPIPDYALREHENYGHGSSPTVRLRSSPGGPPIPPKLPMVSGQEDMMALSEEMRSIDIGVSPGGGRMRRSRYGP